MDRPSGGQQRAGPRGTGSGRTRQRPGRADRRTGSDAYRPRPSREPGDTRLRNAAVGAHSVPAHGPGTGNTAPATTASLLRSRWCARWTRRDQLGEVLADFWLNHFNVFVNKGLDRAYFPRLSRDDHSAQRSRHLWGVAGRHGQQPRRCFSISTMSQSVADAPVTAARPSMARRSAAAGGPPPPASWRRRRRQPRAPWHQRELRPRIARTAHHRRRWRLQPS